MPELNEAFKQIEQYRAKIDEVDQKLVALLNDDIIIPDGFCSRIAEKMNALRGGGRLCRFLRG